MYGCFVEQVHLQIKEKLTYTYRGLTSLKPQSILTLFCITLLIFT